MERPSIVIIGAGISGLSAAWYLSGGAEGFTDQTPRIELIEATNRVGGALCTTTFAGRTMDLGADGFLARRPEALTLVREIGWEDRLEPIDASGAWIWLRDSLYELPTGLALGIPTTRAQVNSVPGLSWRARLAALRDEVLPARMTVGDDATIGDIVRTKLGRELSYEFVEPMVGGIQAGRIDDLSAQSVFPALLEAARQGGSLMKAMRPKGPVSPGPYAPTTSDGPLFYSLRDGVGSLPVELARQLTARGVVVRTSAAVTAVRRTPSGTYPWEVDTNVTTTPAHSVIFATPATITGRLVGVQDPRLDALQRVVSASAAMVTFAIARDQLTLPVSGTGVLVPLATPWRDGGSMMVTAITLLDRKWPRLRRDDDVVLRAHVGRIDDTRSRDMDDETLTARVRDELSVVLPRFATPYETRVQRWPDGLPQYYVGHARLVADAKSAADSIGVSLCGITYDGVGVPAGVGSGRRAANEVIERLSARAGAD